MGDAFRSAPACLVLAADMIIPKRKAGWAYVRVIARGLVLSIFDTPDTGSPTVHGELIVTRRDTGEELLRTDCEYPLSHVYRQMDEMTVAEFCARWNIPRFR